MAEVTLRRLTKMYDEIPAVRGIDLDISDKEFVVLVGPSGCGKSTTLRMVAGLEDITGGEVLIGGVNNNSPVAIQENQAGVLTALQSAGTPLANISREYLAAQISFIAADDEANATGILNSALRCYGLNFAEVNLSNRFKLTADTTVGTLLNQARLAIINNRANDMIRIAPILLQLNGTDPNSRCR